MFAWLWMSLACKEPEPWCVEVPGAALTVCTVDETESPLTVREVLWYRDVDDPDYDGEHDASCANEACSLWSIELDRAAEIGVAARYYGPPHHTPGCSYQDEVGAWVELAEDGSGAPIPQITTLQLDTTADVCND